MYYGITCALSYKINLKSFIYILSNFTGHVSGAHQFDRTTSPSMASVTSGYSVTSSLGGGTGSLRKNLEWDTTADLRTDKHWTENDVEIQNQREAARKIIIEKDNLSQMVIETYSNYFPREDPEGKPSKKNAVTASAAIQCKLILNN